MLARLARVVRVLVATAGLRRFAARLGKVAVVAAAIVVAGAATAYRAEHPVNDLFGTYGDALWWAVVTLTTVGYGDIYPITTTGRVVATGIMLAGVAVLGILAGSLASLFGVGDPEAEDAPPPVRMPPRPTRSTPSCWPCRRTSRRSIAASPGWWRATPPAPSPATDDPRRRAARDGRGTARSRRVPAAAARRQCAPMPSFADPPAPGAIFWLEEALALDPGAPCPPLAGPARADVCIVGGGFTGLWTALELTARDPSLDVVLLEAETCGAGASGRNGGWATGWWDELPGLVEHYGAEHAVWLAREVAAAVDRIGAFSAEHGIDCHYRNAGYLLAATGPAQVGAWDDIVAACREHGAGDRVEELSAEELRRRTGSPLPLGGLHVHDTATIQPALLARGLRRVALERGVRIHEASPLVGARPRPRRRGCAPPGAASRRVASCSRRAPGPRASASCAAPSSPSAPTSS